MSNFTRTDVAVGSALAVGAVLGAILAVVGQTGWALAALLMLLAVLALLMLATHRNSKESRDAAVSGLTRPVSIAAPSLPSTALPPRVSADSDKWMSELNDQVVKLRKQNATMAEGIRSIEDRAHDIARDLYDLILTLEDTHEAAPRQDVAQ